MIRKAWLILILTITISTIALPIVRAQSTSITNLQTPSTAFVGTNATVTVSVIFDLGSTGFAVSIGIFDLDASWAIGTATSSQNTCHQYTGSLWGHAYCTYVPTSTSGSDVVTFELLLVSVKTYRLRASVELFDSNVQLISSASTFQDFTITVSGATTSQTTQVYTTSATSYSTVGTSSLQMPQPPQSTNSQPTSNTQLVIVIGIIAAVALILAYSILRKRKRYGGKEG